MSDSHQEDFDTEMIKIRLLAGKASMRLIACRRTDIDGKSSKISRIRVLYPADDWNSRWESVQSFAENDLKGRKIQDSKTTKMRKSTTLKTWWKKAKPAFRMPEYLHKHFYFLLCVVFCFTDGKHGIGDSRKPGWILKHGFSLFFLLLLPRMRSGERKERMEENSSKTRFWEIWEIEPLAVSLFLSVFCGLVRLDDFFWVMQCLFCNFLYKADMGIYPCVCLITDEDGFLYWSYSLVRI